MAWEVDGKALILMPCLQAEVQILKQLCSHYKSLFTAHISVQNPDTPPDDLPTLEDAKMDHSLWHHYDAVLQFAVFQRILSSYAISPTGIKQGCGAIQLLAHMKAHLMPYFHLTVHLKVHFLHFGSLPNFGAYPYEWNNHTLGHFNNNGHSGSELEGTMMCGWWEMTFIQ